MREDAEGNRLPEPPNFQIPNSFNGKFNQVYTINLCMQRCTHLTVTILETEIVGLADTGASISIIGSLDLVRRFGFVINPCNARILTTDRTPYTCRGYANVPFRYKSLTKLIPTLVVPEISGPLTLGVDFLNAFGFKLVSPVENITLGSRKASVEDCEANMLFAED